MVAVVAGNGLGLLNTSALVLGSRGQFGSAGVGRDGEQVFVNAANGNLFIDRRDEFLIGKGVDAAVFRAYNSQGLLTDDNGDNWRASVSRKVYNLTGTINTAGSTVTRVDWDGSETLYTYNSTRGQYLSTAGAGAYNTLSFASNVWTWTDGDSRMVETYAAANGGRITASTDTDGNSLTYGYNGAGLLTQVSTANGETTWLDYTGTQLTQLRTGYTNSAGASVTMTRVRYGYDASNRLSTVTVDLSPEDNSIADGKTYVTTYTYDGTSNRVASISQTDTSTVAFTYVNQGGLYRVASITQTSANNVTRVSNFVYDTVNRTTTVIDPVGIQTVLTYDSAGKLIQVQATGADGQTQSMVYTYDADGNVLTAKDALNNLTTYGYDGNGNLILSRDAAGNTVTRTYGANNQVLTETVYLSPDPDGAGSAPATLPLTSRYTYDANNHLRFAVSGAGRVTEYRYNAAGQPVSVLQYTGQTYDLTGLAITDAISQASLSTWVTNLADQTQAMRVDTAYDYRGNVQTVTSATVLKTDGTIDLTGATGVLSQTRYVYDQYGNLLQTLPVLASNTAQTYVYDGLGRVTQAVDLYGATTLTQYLDSAAQTKIILASGTANSMTRTLAYNRAGELTGLIEATTTGTTLSQVSYKCHQRM
jgi:YD repeat-containing protein